MAVGTPEAAAPRERAPVPAAAPGETPAEGEPITLPHGDLTVSEAKVVSWRKSAGDAFRAGEIIAEVETDKAILEVEAPAAGRLIRIAAPTGATVKMGGLLGVYVKAGT